ncbi:MULTISPECIES: helix-turn-helix transcriptional regulator [Mesorhizobium]|uniref:YafY family transcriptional regulator n=1 Tax=Mesorhizobium denitrificans TaxID=2294114 RepID=A0A371XE43_9HYPH|nr:MULTISPECIES: YafY family protein [Mesorhizobium]RFC67482.1 YafY family transcriptional regulator [Mesorhizobium denitrificans]
MSRSERLLDLIQILRRHRRPVSGQALAAEIGVSIRTLYRDIATLQGQGAGIEGEPGVGYVLRPGFMLPPLMFTEDEIEAIALGLRWVGKRADQRLGSAARNAVAKIGAVLPDDLRRDMENSALLVGPGARLQEGTADLSIIRGAIRKERKLKIAYRTEGGKVTERVIWPYALAFFDQVRVVAGWCELRGDYRHFRVDRIERLQESDERSPRRRLDMLREWRAREGINIDA